MVEPMFRADFSVGPLKSFTLTGSEGKHASNVRRMRVGEAIQLSNGLGGRIRGEVSAVRQGELDIAVASCTQDPQAELRITLVQALAKGDRDELSVQAATELGISRVIPWQAEHSISRWEGAKIAKSVARWQTIVSEAAKQSMRSFEPEVANPLTTKELIAEKSLTGRRLVLDPTASVGLASLGSLNGDLVLVVGPEGGISALELEAFEGAGFERVHLGAGILRTSTAGVAAIAAINSLSGVWQ
jgi:16S rRNA (uracil1498-N3)-methyltransferase